MSQTLKKRGREPEALPVSTDVREAKRFHGEETDRFCHLLLLDKMLSQEEEECAPSEEVVNGVMESLEEEIGTTSFTFCPSNSGDNSASSDISSGQEGETLASDSEVELFYLLEASDDELGIPLSPVLDSKDVIWQSPKETSEDLLENPDLKSLSEICHFDDDFESYQQFALYEEACEASELQDYINRDFVSQDMFFDGDFSAAWPLETAVCL
jgi:hypothetical protein